MNYQGLVFEKNLPEGKARAGIKVLHGNSLQITYDEKTISFDIGTAELKVGGIDHDMIYFYPPQNENRVVVLVQDRKILDELASSTNSDIRIRVAAIASGMKTRKRRRYFGYASIFLIIAMFVGLVAGGAFTSMLADFVPAKWDEKLGELGYASAISAIAPGAAKLDDPLVVASIEKISKRLTDSLKKSKFNYRITVFKAPVENAFALPGGRVVVFTGILLKSDSPDQIAGILAHEIMHVEKRHAMKQILRSVGLVALFQLFLGDAQGAGAAVIQAGTELLSLGYDRSMESEADREGVRLLARANISAKGLIDFFKKLSENEKELKPFEWLSTHPMSEKRAYQLEELSKKYKPEKIAPIEVDWKAVKNHLK